MPDSGEVDAVDALFYRVFKRIAFAGDLPGEGIDTYILSDGEILELRRQYLTRYGEQRCLSLGDILSKDTDGAGGCTEVGGTAIRLTRVATIHRAGSAQRHIRIDNAATATAARTVGRAAGRLIIAAITTFCIGIDGAEVTS